MSLTQTDYTVRVQTEYVRRFLVKDFQQDHGGSGGHVMAIAPELHPGTVTSNYTLGRNLKMK